MTILEAVDRLNSWVRSDSARRWHMTTPRYAIYDWKNDVIKRAIAAGEAQCSAIYLTLKCRDCDGDGHYVDSSGYRHNHCHKCDSKGAVRLRFLVTQIGGFVWHTPYERTWDFALPREGFWEKAGLSTDWEPKAKGRDLETWQVAEALNVCEKAVLRDELRKPGSHGTWDDYEIRHDRYSLYVGSSPTVCELCGRVGVPRDAEHPDWLDGVYHGCHRDHISWSSWACNACKESHGGHSSAKIFTLFSPPAGSLDHPEIQAWIARREAGKVAA